MGVARCHTKCNPGIASPLAPTVACGGPPGCGMTFFVLQKYLPPLHQSRKEKHQSRTRACYLKFHCAFSLDTTQGGRLNRVREIVVTRDPRAFCRVLEMATACTARARTTRPTGLLCKLYGQSRARTHLPRGHGLADTAQGSMGLVVLRRGQGRRPPRRPPASPSSLAVPGACCVGDQRQALPASCF